MATSDVSFDQLTKSEVITKVISQIRKPRNQLQRFWGMNIGGTNYTSPGGDHVGWDIFDHTRQIAHGRPRDIGPDTANPQKMGHVSAQVYRAHEKTFLSQDRLFRRRPLGQNFGNVDRNGQSYLTRQEEFLAQRFMNSREFMVTRMMRGSFQVLLDGESWIPVDSGGTYTVDYQVPAGNKSQLDMIGAGDIIGASWATASTDILTDVLQINSAFEQLHGYPLRHMWCNSTTMAPFMENTQLSTVAGTANTIFNNFTPEGTVNPADGGETTDLRVVFKAVPWLTWHVYDAVLSVNGTETKAFPDTFVAMSPSPDSGIAEWQEGSEIVAENVMDTGTERFGFHAWTTRTIDPAGWELKAVDNGLPGLYIPKAIAYADTTP